VSVTPSGATSIARFAADFHGLPVRVEADWPDVVDALAERLRGLEATSADGPGLTFQYRLANDPGKALPYPVGQARPVYETPHGQVHYFNGGDTLFLDYGGFARLLIEPLSGKAQIVFRPDTEALWLISHPLFTLALVELLKRRGFYSIHAAGLARGGKSLLLAGTSGAGKSTLTVALLERGLDLLGDDMAFLRCEPEGVRVLAFPDEIDITPHTLGMFPRLQTRVSNVGRPGWRKLQLHAHNLGTPKVAWESEPKVLVFPTIGDCEDSSLEALSCREALLELAPNVLLTEPASSQAHLSALTALISSSDCYRLLTGTNLDAAAQLLDAALQD
jgi:hypothetical protein